MTDSSSELQSSDGAVKGAWQRHCTAELHSAIGEGKFSGPRRWEEFRSKPEVRSTRIIIADTSFDQTSLEALDLSRCYFFRVTFRNANLTNVDFRQSIFRQCDAESANLEGARFRGADMRKDGLNLANVRVDSATDFEIDSAMLPDKLEARLRAAATRARNARTWRSRKYKSKVVNGVLWLTDHGYSVKPIAYVAGTIVAVFAIIFLQLGLPAADALLASIGYFLGLGTAHASGIPLALGLFEGLIGALFFAIITALIISMYFDNH